MENTENRRRYFRIDDVIDLHYEMIDAKDVIESTHVTENLLNVCSLATALEIVSMDSAKLLRRLEKRQPETAGYLKSLEEKIDLLIQAIMMQSGQDGIKNTTEINLSASGLAFQSDKAFETDSFLKLKVFLGAFRTLIVTCGKVVFCEKNPTGGPLSHRTSVDFVNMNEPEQDLLVKYLIKKQSQQIREQKGNIDV